MHTPPTSLLRTLGLDDYVIAGDSVTLEADQGLSFSALAGYVVSALLALSNQTSVGIVDTEDAIIIDAQDLPLTHHIPSTQVDEGTIAISLNAITDALDTETPWAISADGVAFVVDAAAQEIWLAEQSALPAIEDVTPWELPASLDDLASFVSGDAMLANLFASATHSPSVVDRAAAAGALWLYHRTASPQTELSQWQSGELPSAQQAVDAWVRAQSPADRARMRQRLGLRIDVLQQVLDELVEADDYTDERWQQQLRSAALERELLEAALIVVTRVREGLEEMESLLVALAVADRLGEQLSVIAPGVLSSPTDLLLQRARTQADPTSWWVLP